MPDRIRLITPQNESVTSSLALSAKWVRTYEELTKAAFDAAGTLAHVVTRENVFGFLGLQLEKDLNSTPEGYTPGADCVPLMTAGTTDGVTVTDSGNLGTGYEGWRAFDNNNNTRWGVTATSGVLSVTLAAAKIIAGYSIRARNDSYLIDSPKDWTLEGSHDGANWTVLDTQAGVTSWSMNERKEYTVSSPASYLYYRLNISSNQSGTDTSVSEVELLEGVPYGLDYYATGNRVVGPISLSGTAYGDEILQWTLGDMPDGTSVTIGCALTTDETPPSSYTLATNGAQCPVIAENDDMTGKYLWIRQELATSNVEVTPSLLTMQMQRVSSAAANLTIEIDRTTLFSGRNYRSNSVSALPCGAVTTFEPDDLYDGFLYWRARAVNATLGIDTGWSTPNTFNLMGGPFPLPRFFTLVENRQYGQQREVRTLSVLENIGFGKPRNRWALYILENRAFGRQKAVRTLYTELNVTDDPPFPKIDSISETRGQAGSVLTLQGSGFGYTHTAVDVGNINRYLRSYGGFVYSNDLLCNVIAWSWTEITFQLPLAAETGPIKVMLTEPILQVSNSVGFEVYAGLPADDVGIEFFICDRANPNVLVKQLDGAWGKAFQMVRNNPGSGRFKISRYDVVGGNSNTIADDNLVLVKLDGNPLFKWIIEARKPNYVDSGEQQIIEASGRGVLSMLSWAVVYPEELGTPVLDRPFFGTASKVLRTLILEAQARGGLVGVTVDWEDDQDSLGNVFSDNINLSFHVGTPLLEVATKFTDGLGYFDIEMTPELVLRIYKTKGEDLHETVIYRPGQAVISHQNQIDARGVVNEVLVEGGDKLLAVASHSASQVTYGRREGYLSASNIQEGLSEYGQSYLNRVAYPTWGIQGTVTKFCDDKGNRMKPFESYQIGDWIGWNIAPEGADELGFDSVLRVCGITVSEDDDTGELSYTLDLHDLMLEHEIRLNQKVERMSQYSAADVLSVAPSSSGGYSDSEVNNMLAAKADVNHLHSGVYSETDHTHDFLVLTDTPNSYLGQGTKVIAVKPDGSGLEFVTNGGGSSGASYQYPIDMPPAAPHAMDDEFTDTVMHGKWSWINQGSSAWTENGFYGAMDLLSSGDNTRLLVQTAPAGDFTATAKILISGAKLNYYSFGICLYNSTNNKRIIFGKCCRENSSGMQAIKFNSNTTYSSDAYLNGGWDSNFVYVRIRKLGTSYYLDMSLDGDFWWQVFTETISTFLSAISHVGVGYFRNNTNGVTYKGRCDWFRVTEP
jgi:hypothetical protein